jgi:predicted secreted protein
MAIQQGIDTLVKVSVDDSTYYTLAEFKEAEQTFTANNEDVTVFGDEWVNKAYTLNDASYSINGFFDNSDTNGQTAAINAMINKSALYVQILFDGTNGYKQEVKVGSINISSSPDKYVAISMEFQGSGAVTAVP